MIVDKNTFFVCSSGENSDIQLTISKDIKNHIKPINIKLSYVSDNNCDLISCDLTKAEISELLKFLT